MKDKNYLEITFKHIIRSRGITKKIRTKIGCLKIRSEPTYLIFPTLLHVSTNTIAQIYTKQTCTLHKLRTNVILKKKKIT